MIFLQDIYKCVTWRWPGLQPKYVVKFETWIHKKRPVKDQLYVIPLSLFKFIMSKFPHPQHTIFNTKIECHPMKVSEHLLRYLWTRRAQSANRLANGWTVRGSNAGGGKIIRTRPHRSWWGPPSLLYNGYRVFAGGKAAGAWRWPPIPSSAEVKQKVQLYLYSTSEPSWPVLGWPLPLPYLDTFLSLSHSYRILSLRLRLLRSVVIIRSFLLQCL